MKTNELTRTALNWAVAKCEGATNEWREDGPFWWNGVPCIRSGGHDVNYRPSTDWAQGGPIIERENINIETWHGAWQAELEFLPDDDTHYRYGKGAGPTPLIAAMRCYVASKLGDTVDIPEELL